MVDITEVKMAISNTIKYMLFDTENSLNDSHNLQSFIEVIILSVIIPLLGMIINPSDIFFLNASFPWIILPPLLVALRYGTINGMISLFLIAASILLYLSLKGVSLTQFPLHVFTGMIFLNLITGEIIESWKKRFKQQAKKQANMNRHLKQLSNDYRVLQASLNKPNKQRSSTAAWKKVFTEIGHTLTRITQHKLTAYLLSFSIPNTENQETYREFIQAHSAKLKHQWVIKESNLYLLILLPASKPKTDMHHLKQLHDQFKAKFKQSFKTSHIQVHSHYFAHYNEPKSLALLLAKVRQS